MKHVGMVMLVGVLACASDDAGDGIEGAESTGAAADGSGTAIGGTPSVDDAETSSADGETISSGDDDGDSSTSGGASTCSTNDDCAPAEVCPLDVAAAARVCMPNQQVSYAVTMVSWGLNDRGTFNNADLRWTIEVGGQGQVHGSNVVGCPGAWPNEPGCLPPTEGAGATLVLYDYDPVGGDDFVDQICWGGPASCDAIPDDVLHAGVYDGPTQVGSAYVTFEPYALGCP